MSALVRCSFSALWSWRILLFLVAVSIKWVHSHGVICTAVICTVVICTAVICTAVI